VVLRYQDDPVKLADHAILAKETICAVARAHLLRAHFLPKYEMTKAGNGLHVHVSIRDTKTGQPVFSNGPSRMSPKGAAFVEGMLQHVPALMGLTLPTTNSFRRIGVGCWTGSRVGWAVEDKECGIRVCENLSTHEWDHVEYKLCDSSCNLYMGLAALLSCGVDGVYRDLTLRPPLQQNDDSSSEPLPKSIDDALQLLEQDELLCETLGPSLLKGFLAVRRNEAERATKMTLEEEVQEALDRS
jgi:glutamine synthetase